MTEERNPTKRPNNTLIWVLVAAIAVLLCCICLVCLIGGVAYFWQMGNIGDLGHGNPPFTIVTNTPTVNGQGPLATPRPDVTPTATVDLGSVLTEEELNAVDVPQRDLRLLAMQLRPGVGEIPEVVNATAPKYQLGQVITFTVTNVDTNEHSDIEAELRYQTPHVNMWVEKGARVNEDDLKRSADRFEGKTYPTNREFFGSEWSPGVDADVRLNILHARNLGDSIAGYYSSADEFSRLAQPYSNEKEMFYINIDNNRPGNDFYDGTLAHEFQHMIHWYNDRNEETWVNEGLAELAALLNGFDPGGADLAFTANPDTQLNTWGAEPGSNAPHYGGAFLFMTYFLDRFGEAATRAMVASPANGIAGFNEALQNSGQNVTFDDVFADWLVANLLDDEQADNGRYGYKSIDPEQVHLEASYRRFPVVEDGGEVSQHAADYFELRGKGDVTIDFAGNPLIGLVDARAHSGDYAFWSNRGDDSSATLTHTFDLRDVTDATLDFWTWYDLEEDFDYAYVQVSTDGGETWALLNGSHTTSTNPNGNSFGPAYTGRSGGGLSPEWVEEQVDLSQYAGQEIIVRFQYITDDAVNKPGMLIDDISIPQIGYSTDFEQDDGGWESAGWIRSNNHLQQKWLVQVVQPGRDGVTVQRLDVGPDGRGSLSLSGLGANGNRAYLIISAMTPVTTEKAQYGFEIH